MTSWPDVIAFGIFAAMVVAILLIMARGDGE